MQYISQVIKNTLLFCLTKLHDIVEQFDNKFQKQPKP